MGVEEASLKRDFEKVQFSGGILAASVIDGEFGAASFTRDTLTNMDDVIDRPEYQDLIAHNLVHLLAQQGIDFDPLTGQQKNRLPHEVALNVWPGGLVVPDTVKEGRRLWADRWGIPFDEKSGFTIYNQTDASRYINVLYKYISRYGDDILDQTYRHELTGKTRTVREGTLRQLDWMVETIDNSSMGLLEVQEFNPRQTSWSGVMRDGYDSYFHETEVGIRRMPVNKTKPIAYLESQTLAVQAFDNALTLFGRSDDPDIIRRTKRWKEMVRELPDRVVERFRWDDENAFVPAVDRNELGRVRKVYLLSSVLGETFATPEFYANITDKTIDTRHIIGSIGLLLAGPEFATPAGIRMLGLRHFATEGPVASYQGPRTIWGVTQARIADGHEKIELLPHTAHHIYQRFLGSMALMGGRNSEFLPVTADGKVGYRYAESGDEGDALTFIAKSVPSKGQSWTITGGLRAMQAKPPTTPISPMDKAILKKWMDIPMPAEDARLAGGARAFRIDTDSARRNRAN